jgi:hypothetical protein
MKLYRSRELPDHWIGEDQHGALVLWPAAKGGWSRRTPYTGGKRQLEEIDPRLARGSGWPGGGAGRPPRSSAPLRHVGIKATEEERESWRRAAADRDRTLSEWARDELNASVARQRSKGRL